MSTELDPRTVVHPLTGEVLSLDLPDAELALALDGVRILEGELRDVKSALGRELLARMDASASWTLHLPGVGKVTAPSPKPLIEYDGPGLREALLALADEQRRRYIERYPEYCPTHHWPQDRCRGCRLVALDTTAMACILYA